MTTQPAKILIVIALFSQSARADLWNVDFGSPFRGGGPPPPTKTGFAATGISVSDYWNFYGNDYPDGSYKADGSLSNLKNAGGVITGVGITVNNADGGWGYASSDPMLANYIYSLSDSLQTIVTVTNLPSGNYNFYLYGADSHFNLQVGSTDYGTKIAYDGPIIDPPPWIEGQQYVRYANVPVSGSVSVVLTPGAGTDYPKGIIGGMQIESVPEPGCVALLTIGGILLACRARKTL